MLPLQVAGIDNRIAHIGNCTRSSLAPARQCCQQRRLPQNMGFSISSGFSLGTEPYGLGVIEVVEYTTAGSQGPRSARYSGATELVGHTTVGPQGETAARCSGKTDNEAAYSIAEDTRPDSVERRMAGKQCRASLLLFNCVEIGRQHRKSHRTFALTRGIQRSLNIVALFNI